MTSRFHAELVNEPFGDPALYVDLRFERRALFFDLGDLTPAPTRKLVRTSHVFVTHAHIDHLIGFDRLLRACLHRDQTIHLYGPTPFLDQMRHRLSAYTWNLLPEWTTDLVLVVAEVDGEGRGRTATFHSRASFGDGAEDRLDLAGGILLDEETFRVKAAVVDHKIPCLAFALEETTHVNIRAGAPEAMGLPVGPWLLDLKRAVARSAPDDLPLRIWWREGSIVRDRYLPLGALRDRLTDVGPGQKIGYVVDVIHQPANVRAIIELVRGADLLFIEAGFLEEDAQTAAERGHLTALQAGRLARDAGVRRMVPMHFSRRYVGREEELRREAQAAFGESASRSPDT